MATDSNGDWVEGCDHVVGAASEPLAYCDGAQHSEADILKRWQIQRNGHTQERSEPLALFYAIACIRHGWPVFPCWWIENGRCACGQKDESCKPGKHPIGKAVPRGVLDATVYEKVFRNWLKTYPRANLALACGRSQLIVVDIDPQHGGDEWAFWEKLGEPVDTVRTLTPGGGVHIWFKAPAGEFTVSVGQFLPGVDIRAGNGYVMLPPSNHIAGGSYQFEVGYSPKDVAVVEAPAVLAEFARRKDFSASREKGDAEPKPGGPTGFDLLKTLAGLPEGQRDDQIFRAACSFRGTNTRRDVALQAVAEAAARCQPPFNVQEAMQKVYRAYAKYPAGHENGAVAAENIPKGIILVSEYLKEYAERANRPFIWEDLLYRGGFNLFLGRAFTGKSSFAAVLTRAVVLGEPFLNRGTNKSLSAYLALERNGAEVAKMFEAWNMSDKVFFADEIPAQNAADYIEQEVKRLKLQFVIIDHLQHAARIQKGNEYAEVSNALKPYQDISRVTGCCILALHHQGKPAKDREEGTSDESLIDALGSEAYRASADTLLEATAFRGEHFFRAFPRVGESIERTLISIDFESGEVIGTDTHKTDIDAAVERIQEYLFRVGVPVKGEEIKKNVDGKTKIVVEAMRAGVEARKFIRTGAGGKADPYHYSLSVGD